MTFPSVAPPFPVEGRSFSVIGAGRSGIAAANALAERGAQVLLLEERTLERPPTLHKDVEFKSETNRIRRGDLAVLSPGVPEVSPLRKVLQEEASEVMGEIELFYRLCPAPILAITGTDGKSTVTTMLGNIMSQHQPTVIGGNLGNPLCGELGKITPKHVVVAEISCFQLTSIVNFRPHIAGFTNIAEDHINYHGSFTRYQEAKRLLWKNMDRGDKLVLNADDPYISKWPLPTAPEPYWFSVKEAGDACLLRNELKVRSKGGKLETLMMREELQLLGIHNVQNALLAAQMAALWGLPVRPIREALMAYKPLPHRLETVLETHGVTWINDSKATSPNATMAAIKAIDGPLILLLGGASKDSDFSALVELVKERQAFPICFGETGPKLSDLLGTYPHQLFKSMQDAMNFAKSQAKAGNKVVLSPACASFDAFESYEHRGESFKFYALEINDLR